MKQNITTYKRGREREREKKDTGSGRTQAENSDKLSDKARARAGLCIRSLVSIKSSPSARRAPNLPGPICTCIPRRYCTLIDVWQHQLYLYHRGGGSFEFSLFSSLSFGFK